MRLDAQEMLCRKALCIVLASLLVMTVPMESNRVLASDSGIDESSVESAATGEIGVFGSTLSRVLGDEALSSIRSAALDTAMEGSGAIADLAKTFGDFNLILERARSDPSQANIEALEDAGVKFGLANTGNAVVVALGAALAPEIGLAAAAAISVALSTAVGVAAHYGATAITSLGHPSR